MSYETIELNTPHQKILQSLFLNGEMIAKEMDFMSYNNVYKPLRKLVEGGYISKRYVQNVRTGRGNRRYIQAFELTEKGRNYISQRKWRV